jgi:predicted house-cleaning NTP pyrophosphatase (Maf/HAM1 superfamily)
MSQDTPSFSMPDRLAADPASRYFQQSILERDVGIRFNGVERSDVEEYCISEGWVRVAAGKALDRKGRPLLLKLKGTVEAWVKNPAP